MRSEKVGKSGSVSGLACVGNASNGNFNGGDTEWELRPGACLFRRGTIAWNKTGFEILLQWKSQLGLNCMVFPSKQHQRLVSSSPNVFQVHSYGSITLIVSITNLRWICMFLSGFEGEWKVVLWPAWNQEGSGCCLASNFPYSWLESKTWVKSCFWRMPLTMRRNCSAC